MMSAFLGARIHRPKVPLGVIGVVQRPELLRGREEGWGSRCFEDTVTHEVAFPILSFLSYFLFLYLSWVDPFGRRIYKSSGSGTSIYTYDGDNLIEETNGSGAAVARYQQGLNTDEPLAMQRSSTTSYYDADDLGRLHLCRAHSWPSRPYSLITERSLRLAWMAD
jgi:hypothetical protein